MNTGLSFKRSVLWFGDTSALLAQEAVLSDFPVIDCSPLLHCNRDKPFKAYILLEDYNRYLYKCHTIRKDATSSQNMGRFGPVLVRPGRFGLILGVDQFRRKGESFRP